MAVAPIAGVLGVVSTVSGMASKSKEQAIQAASIAANQKASEAAAALSKAELATKRQFAEYQANLNQMTRQTQMMQTQLGLQAQELLSQGQANDREAGLENQRYQVDAGALQEQQGAAADKTNAKMQAGAQKMQASGESASNQTQLANAAVATEGRLSQGNARRGMVEAMMASTQGLPGRSGEAMLSRDINNSISSALAEYMQQAGLSEQDLTQLAYATDMAGLVEALNLKKASFREQTALNAQQYGNAAVDVALKDSGFSRQLDKAGNAAALQQANAANLMDRNSDEVNKIMADYSYNIQGQAVSSQLASQTAALNAQSASMRNSGGMLPGLLNAGLQLYQSFGQGGGGGGSSNPLYQPQQQPKYGILTGTQLPQYSGTPQSYQGANFSGNSNWSL